VEQNEWFDKMKQLTDELHKLSHEAHIPQGQEPGTTEQATLMELAAAACDTLSYITNSSSWHTKTLQSYDKFYIKDQIERVLLWRLK
jgi:hypothetical protein